jgi:hypothetical protein
MKSVFLISLLVIASVASAQSLNEILGYKPTDKLLIINADDAGNSHAANVAIMDMFDKGGITSSTIMVPCSWVPEIAAYAKTKGELGAHLTHTSEWQKGRRPLTAGVDLGDPRSRVPEITAYAKTKGEFGVHLTHTSEWQKCRWRPLTAGAGLADPQGYLWPEEPDVYAHATAQVAGEEARAQIERAMAAGVDVTHIDSHMGTMQLKEDYALQYLSLAKEFRLPVRMGPAEMMASPSYKPIVDKAREMGLLFPDDLVYNPFPRWARKEGESHDDYWRRMLRSLRPGVTEIYIHPAMPTDEIKAMTGSWPERAADHEFFANDPSLRQIVKEQGIILIGYRVMREAQRARMPK